MNVIDEFLAAIANSFAANKQLADRAVAQVDDRKLHEPLDANTNSIAVIMKHVAGNLLSRWTDFLTTDGEKEWRGRDNEFVDTFVERAEILAYWERGWDCLFDSLNELNAEDMSRIVLIRGVSHSVPLALERSLGHSCYHVGQIIQLARFHAGDQWTTLTIPRGESERFNQQHWGETGKSQS